MWQRVHCTLYIVHRAVTSVENAPNFGSFSGASIDTRQKSKKTQRRILVHVVTLGTFWGALKSTYKQFNTSVWPQPCECSDQCNQCDKPSNTVPPTFMWPMAMLAVLMPKRLFSTPNSPNNPNYWSGSPSYYVFLRSSLAQPPKSTLPPHVWQDIQHWG